MLPKLLSQILCLCLISSALGQTCISCISSTTPECLSNSVNTTEDCTANCYTQVDSTGIVRRGCVVEGTPCTAPNCQTCLGENCNKDQIICQNCNSSTDTTCAQGGVSSTFNTVCPTVSAQCYVGLQEEVTVRRCAEQNETTTCSGANANCELCSGVNCNSGIFPANRLQCYQCQGNTNNCYNLTITGTTLNPLVCPNYVPNDKCYSTGSSAANIQRGCESDNANTVCPSGTANNLCTTCSANGCNSAVPGTLTPGTPTPGTLTPSTLTCIECRSDNDANCVNNVSSYGSVTCPASTTTETPKCYQTWYNNLFIRGCLANAVPRIQLICNNPNGPCKTCNTANCNFNKANGAAMNTLASGFLLLAAMVTLRQYA